MTRRENPAMADQPAMETVPARYGLRRREPLLFTTSRWNALAHVSQGFTAIEHGHSQDVEGFPFRAVRAAMYGVEKGGLDYVVTSYVSADGVPLGRVLFLSSGRNLVGCYALRHPGYGQA